MYPGRLMRFKEPFGKFTALQTAQGHGASISTPGPIENWAGEAGGAGGGGVDGVTNSFASGVWYLDALGLYAQARHGVFVRQDFVAAYYGLIEDGCLFGMFTLSPLPISQRSHARTACPPLILITSSPHDALSQTQSKYDALPHAARLVPPPLRPSRPRFPQGSWWRRAQRLPPPGCGRPRIDRR